VPGNVLVAENRRQVARDLVRWIDEAASCHQHGRSQRPRDADDRQELGNVWRQSEWDRTIGIQFT